MVKFWVVGVEIIKVLLERLNVMEIYYWNYWKKRRINKI